MKELAVYFEIQGLAVDEDGNPAPAGAKMSMGEVPEDRLPPYGKLVEHLNKAAAIDLLMPGLDIDPDRVRVITPEEYMEKYGDGDDD